MKIEQNCLIDLHLHLDGSISISSARELASISGVSIPESDDDLRKMLECPDDCKDLNDYLTKFDLPLKLLQSEKALERCAFNLCRELVGIGVIYAEIRFAPQLHVLKGMSQEQAVKGVLRGMESSGLKSNLILCCMRGNSNRSENLETVGLCRKYLGSGVCALDLAGAEALFPNENFSEIFVRANELALPMTIHAGEALGYESVISAVRAGACRIGHGVRSVESEEAISVLSKKKIPLECCPTSNLDTKVFSDYSGLPFRRFAENGIVFTINSDNMTVSGTDVRKELQIVADTFGWSEGDVEKMILASADAAFLSDDEKSDLKRKISESFAES